MRYEETRGRFGFHLSDGSERLCPTAACVQIYVKSSSLSRVADLAISPHLTDVAEIDRFVDEAIIALEVIRADAKRALTAV